MKRVLVGGCFDLIHYGHIRFLEEAKKCGDYLVVALESDENVRRRKGANRPIHSQKERAEMIRNLRMVDKVIELPTMQHHEDYFDLVRKVRPDIIAVTSGDPQLENKTIQAQQIGAQLKIVTPRIKHYSSTNLLREI